MTLSRPVAEILNRVAEGCELSQTEATVLYGAKGADLSAICNVADGLRRKVNGERVGFVVNRNINFTNICYMGCTFCGFAKRREDEGAEWLTLDTIVERAHEAVARGATEVCIQGGIHPKMPGTYYRDIVKALKAELPDLDIHAFSPFEIWYGAAKTKMSYADFIQDLKECGLGSIPGTAAEILDTEVRKQLTKDKLSTAQWVEIIRTAHGLGVPTTATIMYGHVDGPEHWANHLLHIRDLQIRTGGFTEFVPLPFVPEEAPIYLKGKARRGPTYREAVLMHAVARLTLHPHITNIQASWVKMGPEGVKDCLNSGANDVGGTLMNESITRAAGASHGEEFPPADLETLIEGCDRTPRLRTTLYGDATKERRETAFAAGDLEPIVNTPAKRYERDEPRNLVRAG